MNQGRPMNKPTVEMPAMTRARLAELMKKDPEVFTRPTVPQMMAIVDPTSDGEPLDILDDWIVPDSEV